MPFLELVILFRISDYIGALNTISAVILTALAGAYLAKQQGLKILLKIKQEISLGVMPAEELIDGVIVLICGIMFLTPGFITDTIALLGLIPVTRSIIKKYITNKINVNIVSSKTITIDMDKF